MKNQNTQATEVAAEELAAASTNEVIQTAAQTVAAAAEDSAVQSMRSSDPLYDPVKRFPIAHIAEGTYHMATAKTTYIFPDVSAENSAFGLPIFHTHGNGDANSKFGAGFRWSLSEKLSRNTDASIDADYIYTDAEGKKHTVALFYYYLNASGARVYVTDRDDIVVNQYGDAVYSHDTENIPLKVEARSDVRLRMSIPHGEGVFTKFYETRTEEVRQAEERKKQYESLINSYVCCRMGTGQIDTVYDGENFFGYNNLITAARSTLNETNTEVPIYLLLSGAEHAQYVNLLSQGASVEGYHSLESRKQAIINFEALCKEYYYSLVEEEKAKMATPVSFLEKGERIYGFSEYGNLAVVMDRSGNYAAIEYEIKVIDKAETYRPISMYDNSGRIVTFTYDEESYLTRITDANGNYTAYEYQDGALTAIRYSDGTVITLAYDSGGDLKTVINQKTMVKAALTVEVDKLKQITHYSLAQSIPNPEENTPPTPWMSRMSISYSTYLSGGYHVITFDDYERHQEHYSLSEDGRLSGFTREENELVVAAERYTHTPYWTGTTANDSPALVVTQADKMSLYKEPRWNYTFVAGDTETTTYNRDELPEEVVYSPRRVALGDTSENDRTEQVTVCYEYDEAQHVLATHTTKTYTNPAEVISSHVNYLYDTSGRTVRTESYVEGEEKTLGKEIEERFYDSHGNCIKQVSYNSLDSTSCRITEQQYDEVGNLVSEADETGLYHTRYAPATNRSVTAAFLPNGSRHAVGCAADGTVTSVSQSTALGEENNTRRYYEQGLLTKLISGNTVLEYKYDFKRRVTEIKMNGAVYMTYTYTDDDMYQGDVLVDKVKKITAKGEVFETYYDKHGKMVYVGHGDSGSSSATQDFIINEYFEDKLERTFDKFYGNTITHFYDELDRLYRIENFERTEDYIYNEYGQLAVRDLHDEGVYQYQYSKHTGALTETAYDSLISYAQTDGLGRSNGRELKVGTAVRLKEHISYRKVGDHATMMPAVVTEVRKHTTGEEERRTRYTYDAHGNITAIREDGLLVVRYFYDALDRLIREDNRKLDKTWVFEYDNNGNILSERETTFTLLEDMDLLAENAFTIKRYTYDGDRLMSYDGETCTYNAMGQPTNYLGKGVIWYFGNTLSTVGMRIFEPDGFGRIRVMFTLDEENNARANEADIYYDEQERVVRKNDICFIYDHTGIMGMKTGDTTYYLFRKNVQGDVTAMLDLDGNIVATYVYDAWGNHRVYNAAGEDITDDPDNAGHIAFGNPFRYRGYYFDDEMKLYYLQSRFYDPKVKRFISPDDISYIDPETINGLNLYAYCRNNPVMYSDPNGNMPQWAKWVIGGVAVLGLATAVFLTCGVAGAGAASIGAAMLAGGVISAGINAVEQLQENRQFDWTEIAISTISGLSYGLVVGLTGGTAGAWSWGGFAGKIAVSGGTSLLNSWNNEENFRKTMDNFGEEVFFSAVYQSIGYGIGKIPAKFSKATGTFLTYGDICSYFWSIPVVKVSAIKLASGAFKIIKNAI